MFNNQTGFLIDMDGVIYRENHLIPGALEWVALMQKNSIPFIFLTNNSAPTPDDLAIKLKHLGIPNLTEKHFYTSALNTADFLSETHPMCTAFPIGEAGLSAALQNKKIPNDQLHPQYVVVGEGNPTLEKLNKAHELIEKGARLIVTNPDNWCPVGADKTRPGAGALAAYLEASTGQRGYYLGKPNPYMFAQARKRLGKNVSRVVMIGDTMETDIRGAIELGIEAYLVLSGSTLLEDTP
ncbi:MAG: HAD-IIA family hydrolase, partial [Verrucomicrobiota bacterium]